MTRSPATRATRPTRRAAWPCRTRAGHGTVVAREHAATYTADAVDHSSHGPALRQRVGAASQALGHVLEAARDASRTDQGELGALVDLLDAIEAAQAAAIELVHRVTSGGVAERSVGLTLDAYLALRSRLTGADRRTLGALADLLATMPCLRHAFHVGAVGFAALRAIAAEARTLDRAQREELDDAFADPDRIRRMDADQLVDAARDVASRLRPDLAEERAVRRVERRFLHLQPALDGALTLYGELDPEAGATVLNALDAAAGPPTAERDVTTGAVDASTDEMDDLGTSPDGPAVPGSPAPRSRARQRADALTTLAETFLAGTRADGTPTRSRPRMLVWADLRTLCRDDATGHTARLLWNLQGGSVALTPEAARRLASDADLRFVLHDDGEVLGVSEPTSSIPTKVRAAVHARDHGCRFPGCRAPLAWCDLHHVIPRDRDGPTVVDNLVAVCRRHHTAVTEGHWRLTMTPDGTVTVRRGRHSATSDPPHRRLLATPT